MNKLRSLFLIVFSVCLSLSMGASAWAQSVSQTTAQTMTGSVPLFILLGQAEEDGGSKYGISWALILLSVVLGLMVTLKSSGRKTEFKRRGPNLDED